MAKTTTIFVCTCGHQKTNHPNDKVCNARGCFCLGYVFDKTVENYCTGCGIAGDHYCPDDLCSNDHRVTLCENCGQDKPEHQDFLCKECFDLLEPEKDYGDSYSFSKDI